MYVHCDTVRVLFQGLQYILFRVFVTVEWHLHIVCCSSCMLFYYLSDDRSADVFRQKLEATTQMQAVLTPDRRPTCLIVDEIDGAPTVCLYFTTT